MAAPPFFIVGSARSGTTLLRMMLNAHPGVAVPPESRFIAELHSPRPVDVEDFLTRLASHRQFQNWDLPIDEVRTRLPAGGSVPYAIAAAAPYEAYAAVRGRSSWGDKTPRYVEHIELLSTLWPDAHFLHLVRDGRNVALSYADVPFGPKTVAKAAVLWARRVTMGITQGAKLGDRYMEIRYEDFVDDPEGGARSMAAFLEIGFDEKMLDYTTRSRSEVLDRAAKYNPNVTEKPIKSTRSWETDMPAGQIEVFETIGGSLLDRFGYERRYPHPSSGARLKARLGRAGLPVGRLKGRRSGQE